MGGGDRGESTTSQKFAHIPHLKNLFSTPSPTHHQIFIATHQKSIAPIE